jgi:hypothetical protein
LFKRGIKLRKSRTLTFPALTSARAAARLIPAFSTEMMLIRAVDVGIRIEGGAEAEGVEGVEGETHSTLSLTTNFAMILTVTEVEWDTRPTPSSAMVLPTVGVEVERDTRPTTNSAVLLTAVVVERDTRQTTTSAAILAFETMRCAVLPIIPSMEEEGGPCPISKCATLPAIEAEDVEGVAGNTRSMLRYTMLLAFRVAGVPRPILTCAMLLPAAGAEGGDAEGAMGATHPTPNYAMAPTTEVEVEVGTDMMRGRRIGAEEGKRAVVQAISAKTATTILPPEAAHRTLSLTLAIATTNAAPVPEEIGKCAMLPTVGVEGRPHLTPTCVTFLSLEVEEGPRHLFPRRAMHRMVEAEAKVAEGVESATHPTSRCTILPAVGMEEGSHPIPKRATILVFEVGTASDPIPKRAMTSAFEAEEGDAEAVEDETCSILRCSMLPGLVVEATGDTHLTPKCAMISAFGAEVEVAEGDAETHRNPTCVMHPAIKMDREMATVSAVRSREATCVQYSISPAI